MRYGRHAHFSRRRNRRPVVLVISLVLVLALAIGGTVAYLVTRTNPVNNTFTPTDVSCLVVSNDGSVYVKNTGSINAYIRVHVTANYMNNSDNVCAAHSVTAPTPGEGWTTGEGGFYYCNTQVAPGSFTPALFAVPAQSIAGDGCKLEVEVFASAIQPGDAALKAWKGVG